MGTPFLIRIPANAIGDAEISVGDKVSAEKQYHRHTARYASAHGSAVAARREVLHVARSAGVITEFRVGLVVACIGDSTVSVNLYKNGSSILTGGTAIQIDSGDAAFALLDGTFTSAAYVANDVFEVVVTVSAGTGTLGQGLAAQLAVTEAP